MKAEELRIGNLIEISQSDKNDIIDCLDLECLEKYPETNYFNIASVSKDQANIYVFMDEYEFDYLDLMPIPLTEDWLLKFGFDKVTFNYSLNLKSIAYKLNNMLIYLKPDFVEIEYCPDWGKFDDRSHILNSKTIGAHPYGIHQLQNLYFALTQTELTIK